MKLRPPSLSSAALTLTNTWLQYPSPRASFAVVGMLLPMYLGSHAKFLRIYSCTSYQRRTVSWAFPTLVVPLRVWRSRTSASTGAKSPSGAQLFGHLSMAFLPSGWLSCLRGQRRLPWSSFTMIPNHYDNVASSKFFRSYLESNFSSCAHLHRRLIAFWTAYHRCPHRCFTHSNLWSLVTQHLLGPYQTPFFKEKHPNFGASSLCNAVLVGRRVFSAAFALSI